MNLSFFIACFLPIFLDQLKTIYYILPISLITIALSFNNISVLTDYLHEKVVIYSDLIDENESSIDKKNRFQKMYVIFLYISSSILISTLIYYLYFELQDSNLSVLQNLGFIGGWISLVRRTHISISEGLLRIIHKYKIFVNSPNKNKISISTNPPNLNLNTINIV